MAKMKNEQTPDKLLDRGKAFANIGDATRAEEYLVAALEAGASPKDVMPLLLQVCIQTGRYRSGVQHAENQLRRHPDDVRTRFVLGTLQAALGDSKEAHATLERVLAQRPNDPKAHYTLAVLARDAESDVVTADRHFREYLRLEPNGQHAEEARESLLKRVPEPPQPEQVPQ